MEERRLSIPGRYDRIKEASDFVKAAAQVVGLDEQAQHYCQLAVDEACSNIIEHGYEGENRGTIEVMCTSPTAGTLIIELRDRAKPFDPASVPNPNPNQPLEERRGGGWGIYFMAHMMDGLQFDRVDGVNIIRMTKRSSQGLK